MNFNLFRAVSMTSCLLGAISLWSCSTPRTFKRSYSAKELYVVACSPGRQIQSVQGDVRLRVKSSELSGQFPAHAEVHAPHDLRLEITNFIGGTEALISVKSDQFEVTRFRGGENTEKVRTQTWGGIPLKWAAGLFLGRIPCPELNSNAELRFDPQGSLTISVVPQGKVPAQKFVYTFIEKNDKLWPDTLHWEQEGVSLSSVDFLFEVAEDETLSPLKWEARTAEGELKVNWRTRQVNKLQAN